MLCMTATTVKESYSSGVLKFDIFCKFLFHHCNLLQNHSADYNIATGHLTELYNYTYFGDLQFTEEKGFIYKPQ